MAELQKDKWALEEKVYHLENTGSALAEDVIQKSEIIKTYFMETKAGKVWTGDTLEPVYRGYENFGGGLVT